MAHSSKLLKFNYEYKGEWNLKLRHIIINFCRPLISKSISLDQVCDEIVRLGTQNIGKVVMKAEGQK